MKPVKTGILIVDGAHARFVLNTGPGKGVEEITELAVNGRNLHPRDIQADKPGRSFDRAGTGRHAIEYPSDPQRIEQERFLIMVLEKARQAIENKRFDRLIIAAPPRLLGDVRQHLPAALKDKIYAEINKDLIPIPVQDLPKHLEHVLAV